MTRQGTASGKHLAVRRRVPRETFNVEFTKRRELMRMQAEIKRLREENDRLAAMAYRDPLTGLRNRRCLSERLSEEVHHLHRKPTRALSVICIDVNDFKRLNDSAGHIAGDAALIAVSRLLEAMVRVEDVVCRVGGDEFAVLLPDTGKEQAQRVVDRIRAHFQVLSAVGLRRGLAIGLGTWSPGDDEAALLSRADEEMYADKRRAKEDVPMTHALEPFVVAA